MAQINNIFQITGMSGVNGSTWTAVTCPIPRAKAVIIRNRDSSVALSICTDTAGASDSIPASQERVISLAEACRGFGENEVVCYLKGAVSTQPMVWWVD